VSHYVRAALTCLALSLLAVAPAAAQAPAPPAGPVLVDGPNIKVLKDLTVPQFEAEMRHYVQALGVNCGFCHVPRNFQAEDNPRKATARRMIEMTMLINKQFFPDHRPAEGESLLGRVTCHTCHQGNQKPTPAPGQ
jgi:hypothetical protein